MRLKERFILLQMLPVEDGITELLLAEDIKNKIKVSVDEINAAQESGWLKKNDNSLDFTDLDPEVPIDFTPAETSFIKSLLTKASDKKKLHALAVPLYRRFIC